MLKQFVEQNPNDPFPRYGLAMEHKGRGDLEAARAEFAALIERAPDYVASYLMYGNLLAELGETAEAAAAYRTGVEVARKAGDGHAASELSAALAELGSIS